MEVVASLNGRVVFLEEVILCGRPKIYWRVGTMGIHGGNGEVVEEDDNGMEVLIRKGDIGDLRLGSMEPFLDFNLLVFDCLLEEKDVLVLSMQ